MQSSVDTWQALAAFDEKRILDLEQRSIRTPSSTFEEGDIADLYADYMSGIGLEVEMQQVTHPFDPKRRSRQPIGRLKGTGEGPTLLINGHMDPGVEMSGWTVDPYGAKFEDGWIWGMGAHDDKGGCVAAICALEAIVRSGTRLRGDVLMTPVIAHKLGGAGTRALLRHGIKADLCINMEHSNNTIANVCVGVVMVRLVCAVSQRCNMVLVISVYTGSGRHPTSGCASAISLRPPKRSPMPPSDCAADNDYIGLNACHCAH
jgi:acetylornithine deacetylase/succinyl-diaminopimelate desuccinylase-like protein